MKKTTSLSQILIIVGVFILSRLLTFLLGMHLNDWALYAYWQYLDLETLRNNLLAGIWYDHAQPPVFNLFLGSVLKLGGNRSTFLFAAILKMISLANALLLYSIVKKLSRLSFLPLVVAIAYLLSPATLVFECELFYTTSISLLLLISVFYIIRLTESGKAINAMGVVFPLILLCLTRSVYHIVWLLIVMVCLLIYFRNRSFFNSLLLAALTGLVMVGSWYVKNKIIFGKFTASTWIGMNMARNVFHDNEVRDSSQIESFIPFSRIGVYKKFLDTAFEIPYKGLNDRDLLAEMKNDSFINEREVSYIRISDLYQKASLEYIRNHPGLYLKNVFQSSILYFTPATIYSLALEQVTKIKYYDLIYSVNLTHYAQNKQQRRILLTISAFLKMILYFFVFLILIRYCIQTRSISAWNLFIFLTLGFVFGISSLFEHYENMRFRFETEPLFMILAAQVFSRLYFRFQIRKTSSVKKLIA